MYYEFTVQIYTESEETAKSVYEMIKVFTDDEKISCETSVLWEINRRVICDERWPITVPIVLNTMPIITRNIGDIREW